MAGKKLNKKMGIKLIAIIFIIILSIIVSNIVIFNSFYKEFSKQKKLLNIYHPSSVLLMKLDNMNKESYSLILNWVFVDKHSNTPKKNKLVSLNENSYPELKKEFVWYTDHWDKDIQNDYYDILKSMDSLMIKEAQIMDKLALFEDYSNPQIMFQIAPLVVENGDIQRNSMRISSKIKSLDSIFMEKISIMATDNVADIIKFKRTLIWITLFIVIVLLVLLLLVLRNVLYITNNLNKIIQKASIGLLPDVSDIKRRDEIGELNTNLKTLINQLKETSAFAIDIGQNKFDTNFKPASREDILGNALLQMRKNLVTAQSESRKRQEENTQRNWASQGIAVFNEVIRDRSNKLEELTDAVVERLVNYTGSNIGGLFIVNEEDADNKYLELESFYAYDRHKFKQQIIYPGETLIGQCYVENDTIYVSDVPDDYISVTSGLGSDKPKNILIVPLQFNEISYGVIELASFSMFKDYQIDFIEKISETIASAISTTKINARTTKLLEESNEKSERLEQQEIEARESISKYEKQIEELQNRYTISLETNDLLSDEKETVIELLEKTKEEAEINIGKEREKLLAFQNAVNKITPYYEMNVNGDIVYANDLYASLLNLTKDEIIDHKHSDFISRNFINTGNYKQIWDKLKTSEFVNISVQYMVDGRSKFITENIIPSVDSDQNITKIIVFCTS